MSILSGDKIKLSHSVGKIVITPYDDSRVGPNSYDVRLGDTLVIYKNKVLDARNQNFTESFRIPPEGYLLVPGKLYLGNTLEYTETHAHVPILEGRSSVGRLGINIHATAGFGDVGFCGTWTLEISVIQPVRIYAGMEIGQIFYHTLDGDGGSRYNGKYQNQTLPEPSLLHREFK